MNKKQSQIKYFIEKKGIYEVDKEEKKRKS